MKRLQRVAPELPANGLKESIGYYVDCLGFHESMVMGDEYAIVERDNVAIHLYHNNQGVSPGSIHVFSQGLDELHQEMIDGGAMMVQGIVKQPWGNRDFRVADPFGNVIKFTEPLH